MKLLTHNMLSCHIKGVKNGYPFKIDPVKVSAVSTLFLAGIHTCHPNVRMASMRSPQPTRMVLLCPTSV